MGEKSARVSERLEAVIAPYLEVPEGTRVVGLDWSVSWLDAGRLNRDVRDAEERGARPPLHYMDAERALDQLSEYSVEVNLPPRTLLVRCEDAQGQTVFQCVRLSRGDYRRLSRLLAQTIADLIPAPTEPA